MSHQYWSYQAVADTITSEQERAALDEGRRAFALELAVAGSYYPDNDETVARAKIFEAYLKGEADASEQV